MPQPQPQSEKSTDPNAVPPKVKVPLGELGPILARAAAANGITLSEEIRKRLNESLSSEEKSQLGKFQ